MTLSFFAAVLAPVVLAFGGLLVWARHRSRTNGENLVREALLRPPGESLRLKIEELNDKLSEQLFGVMVFPIGLMLVRSFTSLPISLHSDWIYVLSSVIYTAFFFWLIIRTGKELSNYRLGFHGEQAVGEELNQLMYDGCAIFHDVPNDPYGNIDHVIVAPSGVYAVETKTRRKQSGHKVTYDGNALIYPNYTDTKSVEQARYQAKQLGIWLSKATGETVWANAILTIPGWLVTSRTNSETKALNPRQIRKFIADQPRKISSEQLQRIKHQLELRCRTVEL